MKTSLNFGALRDTITRKASHELMNNNDSNTLVRFAESLKKNPIIQRQALLYKNFEKVKPFSTERLAERFIAQNMRLMKGQDWASILRENSNLRMSLLGAPDEVGVVPKKENQKLYENINTLIESEIRPGFNNVQDEVKAYDELISYLTREVSEVGAMNLEESEHPNFRKAWKFITENAISNFNERFEMLSESEKKVFKILTSEQGDKVHNSRKYKDEVLKMINESVSGANTKEEKSMLNTISSKLNGDITEEVLSSDEFILTCYDIEQTILNRK